MYKIQYEPDVTVPEKFQGKTYKSPADAQADAFHVLGASGLVAERTTDRDKPRRFLRGKVLLATVVKLT